MAKQRARPLEWEDAWAILQHHVDAIGSPDRVAGDYGSGFAAAVPASAAAAPGGLAAARADLEAEGCTVTVEALGDTDRRGRWRVTVTHPRWSRGPGGGA